MLFCVSADIGPIHRDRYIFGPFESMTDTATLKHDIDATKELGLINSHHACLAIRALLELLSFRKPSPPSFLLSQKFSYDAQNIPRLCLLPSPPISIHELFNPIIVGRGQKKYTYNIKRDSLSYNF